MTGHELARRILQLSKKQANKEPLPAEDASWLADVMAAATGLSGLPWQHEDRARLADSVGVTPRTMLNWSKKGCPLAAFDELSVRLWALASGTDCPKPANPSLTRYLELVAHMLAQQLAGFTDLDETDRPPRYQQPTNYKESITKLESDKKFYEARKAAIEAAERAGELVTRKWSDDRDAATVAAIRRRLIDTPDALAEAISDLVPKIPAPILRELPGLILDHLDQAVTGQRPQHGQAS